MPDLIVFTGAPASGKSAIGSIVAEELGYRFFHNHLTADPVAELFGWLTPEFGTILEEVRTCLFEHAANTQDIPGIVYTFVWDFGEPGSAEEVDALVSRFQKTGGRVLFIELLASLEARIAREDTPIRHERKRKHDIDAARERQKIFDRSHRMNSGGDFPLSYPHLIIDTEAQDEKGSAQIASDFIRAQLETSDHA